MCQADNTLSSEPLWWYLPQRQNSAVCVSTLVTVTYVQQGNLEGSIPCSAIRIPVFIMHLLTFRIETFGTGIGFVVHSESVLSVVKLVRFQAVVSSAHPAALRYRGSVQGGTRAAPWGTTECSFWHHSSLSVHKCTFLCSGWPVLATLYST